MTSAILSLIVLLAVWRFAFTVVRRRPWLREIPGPHQQYDSVLEPRLLILEQPPAGVIAGNGIHTVPDRIVPSDAKSRAKTYLRRVLALTGAMQTENGYVLNAGGTRFEVRDRYVRRLRDSTSPECGYEETCFYAVHKGMPRVEEIATVLLQLKINPALFDKWAVQNGLAFKADGQVFTGAEWLPRR